MNGILNSGLDLPQLLLLIAAVVAAVVVVKFTISFDINRFLESRQPRFAQKLRNACTHTDIAPAAGNRFSVQSLWVSPPGTIIFMCQRCGAQKYMSDDDLENEMQYWSNHIPLYLEQNKKFQKLLKKSGQA